ncbi:MAG: type II secretion system F family protein [Mycobacteriaceae bacterium]
MSTALLALATALLVAPRSVGARRLRGLAPAARRRWVWLRPRSALGTAVLAFAPALLVFGLAPALSAALAAASVHRRLAQRVSARHRARDTGALTAAVEVLVAELGTGAHPAAACTVAAGEVEGTVHRVFTEAAARTRLGGSAADGLRSGVPALDAELERVAAAWRVAEQHGIALAGLLDSVRRDLAGRSRFARRTQAGLAGARATASVLAGLPLLGIALGQAVGAQPVQLLLTETAGGVLLLVGTVLVCSGLAWTGRITARVVAS